MPEETPPTDTHITPTASEPRPESPDGALGGNGAGCAVLVALVMAVVLGLFVPLVWNSWGATDFPRVAPEETADRVFQRSQEAYGVLGFGRTVEPGAEDIGVSPENTFASSLCYDGGLFGLEDKTVDGAYSMSHRWALDHVPASRAVSGLRRLHRHLDDDGWEVTSYREGAQGTDWDLFVQRDGGAERMSFTWYADREYFTGGASGPCAYDPSWKTGDTAPSGDDQRPPPLGPHSGI
ncbi:hypothetical protein [Streptomyces sp. NPDC058371]|uniref:hypothetical protein n=1 Tax=Streptomyces sp. NPDC058371 TaxID=3346463 RepID=UPI0036565AF0